MPIPAAIASRRAGEGDWPALEIDLAVRTLQKPVEDIHQGRFAGAVLAHERMNLAAADIQLAD